MTTSDPRRWAALRSAFEAIVDLPVAVRAEQLAELRSKDAALADDLEKLLRADESNADADADPVSSRLDAAVRELAGDLGAALDERLPAQIGDYRIKALLGSGGMGAVYLAEQQSPRRVVALKVIRGVGGETAVRRFQREAELLGRLQHANIALIHEAGLARERDQHGVDQGALRPYFAMEFVRGEPVVDFARTHALDTSARVELIARICDAIEHAHARGVIHRDLKSANILVDEQGQPKVLDFGIARALDRDHAATIATAVGEVIGTLPYMSPEQVSGRSELIGVTSDVYALGVVLFETLTGKRPIDLAGRTLPEAVRLITDEEPTRLASIDRTLRGDLETIVARCLEKDPSRRYPSAAALAADLRRHLAHQPIDARPASTLYQLAKFTRRHRPLVVGIATAFAAMIVATVISITMALRADIARADAEVAQTEAERAQETAVAARKDAEKARDEMRVQLRLAQEENARSTQSFALIQNLLAAADPSQSGGGEMTVRQFLLKAAGSITPDAGGSSQVAGMVGRLLAHTLLRIGERARGEEALRDSIELLKVREASSRGTELTLLQAMTDLADLLRLDGRIDQAEAQLLEIIARREENIRLHGDQGETAGATAEADFFRSVALANLALILGERGDHAGAEAYASRAYEMERSLVAMGHLRRRAMAICLFSRSASIRNQGRVAEAIDGFREALEIIKSADGADAPVALRIRGALALALHSLGRFEEACAVGQSVVQSFARAREVGDPELSLARAHLAQYLSHRGAAIESASVAHRALDGYRKAGAVAVDQATAQLILAGALNQLGDFDDARVALDEAEVLLRDGAPNRRGLLIDLWCHRAFLARASGRHDEALACAESGRAIARELNDETRSSRLELPALREWAFTLASSADSVEAQRGADAIGELLPLLRESLGEMHPMVGRAWLHRAEALLVTGDRAGAAASADEAVRVLEQPGGLMPWWAEYARMTLEIAGAAGGAIGAGAARSERVDRLRAAIINTAGGRATELVRLRRIESPTTAPVGASASKP